MTDILDDLTAVQRTRGDTYSSAEVLGMVGRAAEEITKLRERCAGYKGQVECGAAEIERLREAQRTLWFVLKSNGGYTMEKSDMEEYPGDDRAVIGMTDHRDGTVSLAASVRDEQS